MPKLWMRGSEPNVRSHITEPPCKYIHLYYINMYYINIYKAIIVPIIPINYSNAVKFVVNYC